MEHRIVKMNSGEITVAKELAGMRRYINLQNKVRDAKIGEQSAVYTEVLGTLAELAFAREFNVCPDLSVESRCGGSDLRFRGWTVDLKGTAWATGRLLATLKKLEHPSDIYALACVSGLETTNITVRLIGWAWGAELLRPEKIIEIKGIQTYSLEQDELHDWSELKHKSMTPIASEVFNGPY